MSRLVKNSQAGHCIERCFKASRIQIQLQHDLDSVGGAEKEGAITSSSPAMSVCVWKTTRVNKLHPSSSSIASWVIRDSAFVRSSLSWKKVRLANPFLHERHLTPQQQHADLIDGVQRMEGPSRSSHAASSCIAQNSPSMVCNLPLHNLAASDADFLMWAVDMKSLSAGVCR